MIATRQLHALGVDRGAIQKRVLSGRLTPFGRGVYLVGPLEQPYSREMAALLACPESVLAFESAAHVLKIAPRPQQVHLISATQRRSRPGIVVHRARLTPAEIWDGQSLSLTSPYRTLSDIRKNPVFAKAVWEASHLKLITGEEARELLGHEAPEADHEGERVLVDLIRQAGLPPPQTNVRIGRWEIDLYWPDLQIAVELDGKAHDHELAKERDARKTADLARRGITLLRIPGTQLSERPLEALATIAAGLARRA